MNSLPANQAVNYHSSLFHLKKWALFTTCLVLLGWIVFAAVHDIEYDLKHLNNTFLIPCFPSSIEVTWKRAFVELAHCLGPFSYNVMKRGGGGLTLGNVLSMEKSSQISQVFSSRHMRTILF